MLRGAGFSKTNTNTTHTNIRVIKDDVMPCNAYCFRDSIVSCPYKIKNLVDKSDEKQQNPTECYSMIPHHSLPCGNQPSANYSFLLNTLRGKLTHRSRAINFLKQLVVFSKCYTNLSK